MENTRVVDASNEICPVSILMLKQAVKSSESGTKITFVNNQAEVVERRINEYGLHMETLVKQEHNQYFQKVDSHTYIVEVA